MWFSKFSFRQTIFNSGEVYKTLSILNFAFAMVSYYCEYNIEICEHMHLNHIEYM